jgi:hypothetical protein
MDRITKLVSREMVAAVAACLILWAVLAGGRTIDSAAHAIDIPPQHRRNPQPQRVNPTDKHVLLVMPVGSKTVWYASKIIKHASGMGGTDTAFVNSETGETVKIIGMGTVIITEPPKLESPDSSEKPADKER